MSRPQFSRVRRHSFALISCVCLSIGWGVGWLPSSRAADDTLYGALILATNVDKPVVPPEELKSQAASLHTVFGYNHFRILGQRRKTMTTGMEDWLVPSRQFFLRVDAKGAVPNGYALGLELLRDDHVIVSADVKLSRERPLYIRGPFVGEGQLLILLMVL